MSPPVGTGEGSVKASANRRGGIVLERRPHHASFGAEGGAVDDGALGAGDEGYDGGDFFGLLEAFQERAGARFFEKFGAIRG